MIRESTAEAEFKAEEVSDAAEIARCSAQDARAKSNSDWLQANWPALLPQARGQFVAVAGQEAFVANTAGEAWQMARAAHPEDDGAISQFVFPTRGPRIFACHQL
jgi:hypothetical protein